jgi:hypothetical protein
MGNPFSTSMYCDFCKARVEDGLTAITTVLHTIPMMMCTECLLLRARIQEELYILIGRGGKAE